jgi:transcriptional regulator with XRE-family HTH domain
MGRRKNEEAAERKRLGAEITRRMVVAELTPADLAAAAEVDDSQMSKVLAGKAGLSLYSLRRVAAALGCTRSEILAAVDMPKVRRVAPARSAARVARDNHPTD